MAVSMQPHDGSLFTSDRTGAWALIGGPRPNIAGAEWTRQGGVASSDQAPGPISARAEASVASMIQPEE
jgi:hypothetical protein